MKIMLADSASGHRSDDSKAPGRTPSAWGLMRWSQLQQGDEGNGDRLRSVAQGVRPNESPTPDAVPLSRLRRHELQESLPNREQLAAVFPPLTLGTEPGERKLPDARGDSREAQVATLLLKGCERVWVDATAQGKFEAVIVDLGRWWPGCTAELSVRGGPLRVTLRGGDARRSLEWDDALEALRADLAELCGRPARIEVDVGRRGER